MRFNLNKRNKFLLVTVAIGVLFFMLSRDASQTYVLVILLMTSLIGNALIYIPNINLKNFLYINLPTVLLLLGVYLSFVHFPNLGLAFKLSSLIIFAFLYYLILLVNNIFLVIEERGESIPLYRVASTWSKIILVIIAIPFFAGVFKLSINGFYQGMLVSFTAMLITFYLFWTLRYDQDKKKATILELFSMSLFNAYMVFSANLAASFFPTESFLRGLFVATVLMFGINFVYGHLKNSIKESLINEHFIISTIFFFLLLIFTP